MRKAAKRFFTVSQLLKAGFLTLVFVALAASCLAQTCPSPWNTATQWVGTMSMSAGGTAPSQNGAWSITASGSATALVNLNMVEQGYDFCNWYGLNSVAGSGNLVGGYSINETATAIDPGCPPGQQQIYTLMGSGSLGGTSGQPVPEFNVFLNGDMWTYSAPMWGGGVLADYNYNNCGQISQGQVSAPLFAGTPPYPPLPTTDAILSGSTPYMAYDPAGYLAQLPGTLTFNLTQVPDDTTDEGCDAQGSDIGCQNQSLGEDVPIAGTSFFLRYQSNRVLGRGGADTVAILDALSLGGWTIDVHHVLQLQTLNCLQNSVNDCSVVTIVPKALYLGSGRTRSVAKIGSPVIVNGNYYITSQDGSEVYAFNPSGTHLQTLKALTGAIVYQFGYDTSGNLTSITDASGNITTIQRDGNENPTAVVAPYGQTTKLAVWSDGSHNYLSTITDPAGKSYSLAYAPGGLLTSLTDRRGNAFTFQYDSLGRLTRDSDPAGGFTTLTRTNQSSGYSITKQTAMGVSTTYQLTFPSSNATEQDFMNTYPDGLQATEASQPTSHTSNLPSGEATNDTLSPDPRWGIQVPLPASTALTLGSLTANTTFVRNANFSPGNPFSLTSQTDTKGVNGRTYSSTYTASNSSIANVSPVGRQVNLGLDNIERISSAAIGNLTATSLSYDGNGRVGALIEGPRTMTLNYGSDGHISAITDPLNQTSNFTYDPDGRLLTSALPDGRSTSYAYDANGNLTSVTPPGKSAHTFNFTPVNLISSYMPPVVSGTGPTMYTWNLDRKLTTVTRPDGQTINYTYDNADRLSSIVAPTETINYTYDSKTGNLTNASIAGGEGLAMTYLGMLPASVTWSGPVAATVTRAYNNNFWLSAQTIKSAQGGTTIPFTYDNDGLLIAAGSMKLQRDPSVGLITATSLGGVTDSYTYDAFGKVINYTASFNGSQIYSAAFTRDADSRVTQNVETINGATTTYGYTYDLSGRLTAVTQNGVQTSSYTYDSNSNRLSATINGSTLNGTYDAQDRLLTYGGNTYTYTANGELTSETIGGLTTTYRYDVLGNLLAATLANGKKITYVIDPQNRRIGKKINGALVQGSVFDGAELIGQGGAKTAQFVYASRSNVPDYMLTPQGEYRIISDHLGSPRLIVNISTGTIAEQIDYDEFGNVTSDSNPGFQPFGFAGGSYDQDTKLVRFGARDYDPNSGRWTAKDPLLFQGGDTNLYTYVLNDPVNTVDSSGFDGVHGIGITVIGGLAEIGVGPIGVSVQGNVSQGTFWGGPCGLNSATFASYGFQLGSSVLGASAGIDQGIWITNATSANELAGPFDVVNGSFDFFSVQFATSGNTWQFTIGPSFGSGGSLSSYSTTTWVAEDVGIDGQDCTCRENPQPNPLQEAASWDYPLN